MQFTIYWEVNLTKIEIQDQDTVKQDILEWRNGLMCIAFRLSVRNYCAKKGQGHHGQSQRSSLKVIDQGHQDHCHYQEQDRRKRSLK